MTAPLRSLSPTTPSQVWANSAQYAAESAAAELGAARGALNFAQARACADRAEYFAARADRFAAHCAKNLANSPDPLRWPALYASGERQLARAEDYSLAARRCAEEARALADAMARGTA